MSCEPIGVFDSGLGGLTAVKELLNVLPNENIVYFGDTGRVPYGNRSKETIIKYAVQDANFLLAQNVKMVIAACGTVSSVAREIDKQLNVPFTGVVMPTAFSAVQATKNNKIGVIGTTATINSGSYKTEIQKFNSNINVYMQDCPLFVPLVENGFISKEDPVVKMVVERYLQPLIDINIDTLIMGCTHYPILRQVIAEVMGSSVTLIDSGKETALYASTLLKENNLLNTTQQTGSCSFYVSDRPDGFTEIAGLFLGKDIENDVTRIDIEEY